MGQGQMRDIETNVRTEFSWRQFGHCIILKTAKIMSNPESKFAAQRYNLHIYCTSRRVQTKKLCLLNKLHCFSNILQFCAIAFS